MQQWWFIDKFKLARHVSDIAFFHTTSCIIQSNASDDGQNYCPKHIELI